MNDHEDPEAAGKRRHRTPQQQAHWDNHVRHLIPLTRQLGYLRSAGFWGVDVYWAAGERHLLRVPPSLTGGHPWGPRERSPARPTGWLVYRPASDPPMPPRLKYLFRTANRMMGGSIMMTATAMTRPQLVWFCWKKVSRPMGRV